MIYDYDFDRIGCFIVVHHGANFTQYFGPFRTFGDAVRWRQKAQEEHNVAGGIVAVCHPDADRMWGDLFVEVDSHDDIKPDDYGPHLPYPPIP